MCHRQTSARQFCHDSVSTVVCAATGRLEFGAKLQKLCSRALLQRPAAAFLFPWRGTSVAEKKLSIVTFVSVPIQKVASSLHLVLLLILTSCQEEFDEKNLYVLILK